MAEFLRTRSSTSSSIGSVALQESGYKKLCIFVNRAWDLPKGDTFGLSDPYVRISVVGGEHAGPGVKKTSVVKKSLDPVWAELLHFWVRGDAFSVIVDVFDENKLIKDDFLGRQMLHFDFTNESRRPPVVQSLEGRRVQDVGRTVTLKLKNKYAAELLDGQYRPYLKDLRSQFFLKRLHRHRWAGNYRGRLNLSFIFLDPSDDFEHLQLPGITETTPTHTSGGEGVATEQEAESEVELPPGWEERTDTNGRRFYINHLTRVTSLRRRPVGGASTPETTPTPQAPQRRAFMARHTSIDVIDENTAEEEEEIPVVETPPQPEEGSNLHTLDSISLDTHPHPPSPSPSHPSLATAADSTPLQPSAPPLNLTTPTVRQTAPQTTLLTVVPQATPTPVPQATRPAVVPRATPTPAHLAMPTTFKLARVPMGASPHHSLAIQRAAHGLPQGWQAGMTSDGRVYYINHIHKTTTWEKPRLQERHIVPVATRTAQPVAVEQDSSLPEGWEERRTGEGRVYYVDHNTQTTSWDHPNSKKEDLLGPMPARWEMKQMADGRLFFVDHNTNSTQWEDPRLTAKNKPTEKMKYSRDYKQKYSNFRFGLPKTKPRAPNILELPIRREHVFEDSFRAVTNVRPLTNFHSRLYVRFAGESGLDYGGLAREWFFLLSHEMFSPYYGLFEYAASDDYTLQISPESGIYNEHHIDYFKFVGRMLGLAIYHQHLLDGTSHSPYPIPNSTFPIPSILHSAVLQDDSGQTSYSGRHAISCQ
ncbi:E3 ubiquitin-protein ligase NEDD4-like [Geodia barretti]|uniref:HECT-type E3 ubiquitin transferase n=1 Tax=Geodia barretti TaxID=519541 RepID=A0AA35R4N0_GEOBA|nr:E3 ubiquitin-protein ligase NEDD4-like [Geodia barretti]